LPTWKKCLLCNSTNLKDDTKIKQEANVNIYIQCIAVDYYRQGQLVSSRQLQSRQKQAQNLNILFFGRPWDALTKDHTTTNFLYTVISKIRLCKIRPNIFFNRKTKKLPVLEGFKISRSKYVCIVMVLYNKMSMQYFKMRSSMVSDISELMAGGARRLMP